MNWFEFILFFIGMIILGIWGIMFIIGKYNIDLDLQDTNKTTSRKTTNKKSTTKTKK